MPIEREGFVKGYHWQWTSQSLIRLSAYGGAVIGLLFFGDLFTSKFAFFQSHGASSFAFGVADHQKRHVPTNFSLLLKPLCFGVGRAGGKSTLQNIKPKACISLFIHAIRFGLGVNLLLVLS